MVTKELSKEDNYWVQSLRSDLRAGVEIEGLAKRYEVKRRNPYYQAVMDLIVRANREEMEEAKGMCKAILELFADEFEEKKAEIIRQTQEETEYRTKRIFKLYAVGMPFELIAQKCGVSVEKVQQILE